MTCIAAGNCAFIKGSELGPYATASIKKLVTCYLDRRCYRVIEGEVEAEIELTK